MEAIIETAKEETSRERNVRLLGEVVKTITEIFGNNLAAKFVAAPGFLAVREGQLDCEVVTLQVFLPHTPAGSQMADQIIRQATGQGQERIIRV